MGFFLFKVQLFLWKAEVFNFSVPKTLEVGGLGLFFFFFWTKMIDVGVPIPDPTSLSISPEDFFWTLVELSPFPMPIFVSLFLISYQGMHKRDRQTSTQLPPTKLYTSREQIWDNKLFPKLVVRYELHKPVGQIRGQHGAKWGGVTGCCWGAAPLQSEVTESFR